MEMKLENKIKFLAILSYIFVTISLVIINNSPVTGYELSIYTNNPFIWILLILSNIFGITIIVSQVFDKNKKNIWLVGFSILIFTNFIILSLHALKGYYLYNYGDSMGHYDFSNQILLNGYISSDNSYPIVHILIVEIIYIGKLSAIEIMRYLPAFFSVLFMLFIYILGESLLQKRGQVLLVSILGSNFFFSYYHVSVYPSGLSVLMLPLVFYLYFKGSDFKGSGFKLSFIILIIIYPFFHPATSSMLILFLIILELTKGIYKKRIEYTSFNPVLVSSITFILWISNFWFFNETIKSIYTMILGAHEESYFISEGTKAIQNIQGLDLIELFTKMYGIQAIYSMLSLIATILIIKRISDKRMLNMFILSIFFITSMPLSFFLFISSRLISVGRLLGLNYIMVVTPILSGFSLYELIKTNDDKKNKKKMIMVIFILSLIFTTSVLSIYRSPWIFQQNWQATYSFITGSKWFKDDTDKNIISNGMGFYEVNRPPYYRYGDDTAERIIPAHFNYSNYKTLGEQFKQKRYIVVTQMSKLANADPTLSRTRMDPAIQWGFNEKDFYRFENYDTTINKLYTNGEFWVYTVN